MRTLVTQYLLKQASQNKTSSVRLDPTQTFFYIPMPVSLQEQYIRLGKRLFGDQVAEINDHITLLYIPRRNTPVSPDELSQIKTLCAQVCSEIPPIQATVQGWAYFDGAGDDGKQTALVGLVDAPGLADIHVGLKKGMANLGFNVDQNHGFTPHTTFAYLPQGARVDGLPLLNHKFTIDKAMLASAALHEFPLGGEG